MTHTDDWWPEAGDVWRDLPPCERLYVERYKRAITADGASYADWQTIPFREIRKGDVFRFHGRLQVAVQDAERNIEYGGVGHIVRAYGPLSWSDIESQPDEQPK